MKGYVRLHKLHHQEMFVPREYGKNSHRAGPGLGRLSAPPEHTFHQRRMLVHELMEAREKL